MKRLVVFLTFAMLANATVFAQTETPNNTPVDPAASKERKAVIKKVEKQEKAAAKAEKAYKKSEKKQKKEEKLVKAIQAKKNSISKKEKQIVRLQEKLVKGEANGKLSPVDITKMNAKLHKRKAGLVKDREKLAKLMKKQ